MRNNERYNDSDLARALATTVIWTGGRGGWTTIIAIDFCALRTVGGTSEEGGLFEGGRSGLLDDR